MTVMRIIDLQRRLREIGRIRTGDTTATSNGSKRPRKLERFRLTSRDRKVIDVAAATWGGPVSEWDAPDGRQWQVYLDADELSVIVPPGDMSFSQSYEQWSAGGCQARCDGQWDHLNDKACHCDPSDRDCNLHTRLSVMVPDLPGIGVWRLETHSYYAAVELGGLVDLCAAQAAAGTMIPARLRLEQRSVKRVDKGKVVTRRFAVPVLDLDVHPLTLGPGGQAVAGQLAPASPAELGPAPAAVLAPAPAITPVPEPERALRPSVADQIGAVNDDRPRDGRRSQAAVPRTGLKPRTADEAAATAADEPASEACSVCGESYRDGRPVRRGGDGESPYVHKDHDDGRNATGQAPPAGLTARQLAQKSGLTFADHVEVGPRGGKSNRMIDRLRHALVYAQTGGTVTSSNACTPEQLLAVWQRLDDIAEGRMTYELEPDSGVTWVLGTGKRVTVMWTELEGEPEPAAGAS